MENYIKFLREASDNRLKPDIGPLQEELSRIRLPVIKQIKEKFGILNVYIEHTAPEDLHYVTFAETLSAITCEECGSTNNVKLKETPTIRWLKTKCEKCWEAIYEKDNKEHIDHS